MMTMLMMSDHKKEGLQKRRHMVLNKGKELYEWEQSNKKVILRIPVSSASTSASVSSPRGGESNNNNNIFCIITDNFVQLGCRNGDRLPPTWYLSCDTGGKVNATKSKWTTSDDDGICTITLYKQKQNQDKDQDTDVWPLWRYALLDDRVDDVKTLLKRPKRTSSTRSHSRS
jgi:hypothetical protein